MDVDRSLWDLGSIDVIRVIDTVEHIQYMMVHDDTMVCNGI